VAVGEEGDLAGGGVLESRDARDFGGGIAIEVAGKFFSEGRKFHREGS